MFLALYGLSTIQKDAIQYAGIPVVHSVADEHKQLVISDFFVLFHFMTLLTS
jgi:hypothetical protein